MMVPTSDQAGGERRPLAPWIRDGLPITLGALLMALTVDLFLVPGKIAPGGVSGLAIILNAKVGWNIGLVILLLNIPMLWLGFVNLGRFHFLVRTIYVVVLYTVAIEVLARGLPVEGITGNPLLNALYGGVVGGIGSGLVYRGGGTPAGTGIAGRVLQKRSGIPISQVYMLTDGGVIVLAGVIFGWESALYALLSLFIWGLATDYVLEGPSVIRTAFIITDQPEAVAHALLTRLGIGVTAWGVQGKFTEQRHTLLFCTIGRPDVGRLNPVVSQVDPQAFVVIMPGHQARGGVIRPLDETLAAENTTHDAEVAEPDERSA
jgi:uncharacterized membrane-anchored protein YitT (DUF2179 family)